MKPRSKTLMNNPKSIGNMKKKVLLLCAVLSALLSGCNGDPAVADEPIATPIPTTIYATIDDSASRVQLNEHKQTVWTANDNIVVFSPQSISRYRFLGETGSRSGSFGFDCDLGDSSPKPQVKNYLALYHSLTNAQWGSIDTGEQVIFAYTKHEQTHLPSSYGVYSNVMVGMSDDGANYTFHNLCGFLRLSFKGVGSVKSIELRGNGVEPLAGRCYFTLDDPLTLHHYDQMYKWILLNCGFGVKLSNNTPTDFYFALSPVELKNGFRATITMTDGKIYTKQTTKHISIRRNEIQPMATLNLDEEWTNVTIQHSGKYFGAPYFISPPYEDSVIFYVDWGDGTTSNHIDASFGHIYNDSKPSHTVVISSQSKNIIGISMQLDGVTEIDLSEI